MNWALGYMLNATNEIPDMPAYVTNDYNLSTEWFIIGVVVLGITIVIAIISIFVILCYGYHSSRQSYAHVEA